jgi:hypothetical protein
MPLPSPGSHDDGRARTAPDRVRHAGCDRRRGFCRAGPARAGGHRRDRPQAHRRDQQRADRPDRAACPRRPVKPGDRQSAVHQRARSSTTWARSSPSSPSARAASSTASCPATGTLPGRASPAEQASQPRMARPRLATGAVRWRIRARPCRRDTGRQTAASRRASGGPGDGRVRGLAAGAECGGGAMSGVVPLTSCGDWPLADASAPRRPHPY